jgi:phosphohistidine phosphatase SixA
VVTDRDLVVRALAEARDAGATLARDVCGTDLVTCSPQDGTDQAVRLSVNTPCGRFLYWTPVNWWAP